MKNKDYYLQLAERYFDAELSEIEEIRLKRFLATTDDPRFNGVKAVMGYLSIERRLHASRPSKMPGIRLFLATTLAAACLLIGFAPLLRPNICVHKANGVVTSNENLVMGTVEEVLSDFFSSDDEINIILNEYLNNVRTL